MHVGPKTMLWRKANPNSAVKNVPATDGCRIVDEEKECSEQSEKSPERSEDNPAYALRCGDDLNVAEIESLVAFDQYQLFDQEEVIRPQIELCPQAWNEGH